MDNDPMERLMRYKTLQCFLAALIMIAFLAPASYASGAPDAYEASANAVSEKYIGKTVPGACVVISEHDNSVFAKGYGFADLEKEPLKAPCLRALDPEQVHLLRSQGQERRAMSRWRLSS